MPDHGTSRFADAIHPGRGRSRRAFFIYGRIWLRRRRETPLRCEIRARDVTFRAVLDRVSVREPGSLQPDGDFDVPISSPVPGSAWITPATRT